MPKFHSLIVKDIRRETGDCVSVAFEVPEELRDEYVFTPGQYLTLKAELEGEELRRSYSICAGPDEGELRVAVRRVEEGRFSTFINDRLQIGQAVEVMTPMGRFFTPVDPPQARLYVAFAAGSGITPVISILKAVLCREPLSRFVLVYANRSVDSIMFREELEGLKNRFLGRLSLHYVLSRETPDSEMFSGRIDAEKTRRLCNLLIDVTEVDEFFLCGPFPMIEAVSAVLRELGVDKKHIHFELFTPAGGWKDKPRLPTNAGPDVEARITITLDGNTFSFPMSANRESILEAAQRAGAELPYACKGGVCSTCRAHLDAGEVALAVNYALEDDEIRAGYILTCQAFPKSKEVRVNFDR